MAETKTKKTATKKTVTNDDLDDKVTFVDSELEKRVSVHNISNWKIGMNLKNEQGSVEFTPNGIQRVARNELMSQMNSNNVSLLGIDGKGSHATLYIDDAPTRRWLGFETKDEPQKIFTDDVARKLFEMSFEDYKRELPNYIVTRAEKYALSEAITRLKFNDYRKIMYAKDYTGFPIN